MAAIGASRRLQLPIPAARSLEAAVLRSEEDIFDGVVELILEDMASAS